MATFKVGQRVRIVAQGDDSQRLWGRVIGREGVVVLLVHPRYHDKLAVRIDGDAHEYWGFRASSLAPLTDPGCESFLQAMRDYANKQRTPVDVLRELHGEYL
jgi:hypothetical protein